MSFDWITNQDFSDNLASYSWPDLTISNNSVLTTLGTLPNTLKNLWVDNCPNLVSLGNRASLSLDYLSLSNCPKLLNAKELPAHIRNLHIKNSPILNDHPVLPRTLIHLLVDDCDDLTMIRLPENVTSFGVTNCQNLRAIDGRSIKMSFLCITNCPSLTRIANIPRMPLDFLIIDNCPALKLKRTLSGIPQTMHITKCPFKLVVSLRPV